MELTQLDSGEIQLEHDVFDLTELVATTADQMKLLAEDKQIQLETQLSPAGQGSGRPVSPEAGAAESDRQRDQVLPRWHPDPDSVGTG